MSEAIMCDRCGKYEPQMVGEKNPWARDWVQVHDNATHNYRALCPSCSDLFARFMDNEFTAPDRIGKQGDKHE